MKYQTLVWRDKDGSNYLIYNERTTHTGTHVDTGWTPELEQASRLSRVPDYKIRQMVVPVFVDVETTVTLTEE